MSGEYDPRDDWGPEERLTGYYEMVFDEYNKLPEIIQNYFNLSVSIIVLDNKTSLDILIAYVFMKVEQAQRMILYAAIVKKYKVDKDLARKALDDFRMTRPEFLEFYKTLAGKPVNKETIELGKEAEGVRDNILHGRKVKDVDKGNAILDIFEYSRLLNEQANKDFGFQPFGDMRGFKGKIQSHDKETSKWILMGMKLL